MRYWISIALALIAYANAYSQCVVYDGLGNTSQTPTWVSCSGGSYTLYVQSPNAFGALSIDWGDGSALTNVASLIPPAFISHTYAAAIANYNVVITEASSGCVINGLVVMEEPVNASIQIPIGGVTQTCAPDILSFTNSSTDVSTNTTFIWTFGDGSPTETYGDTNAGQTVYHTYQKNTVNCVTQVTLSAENYCSFGNPTVASFNPIQIYDVDDAQTTASNLLLCYPDTVVHFANTTAKNCVPQGNTAQRFEYWNFGNYWGLGQDSIIKWQPFDPPARPGYDIAFPGVGIYTIMMADSNQCGADTVFTVIQITTPPTANFQMSTDSSCTGDPVTFTRLSVGGNQHLINYGDGSGYQAFGATATHTYSSAGTKTITVVANITGGSASCTDTMTLDIVILPSPTANASISPGGGCDTVNAVFVNTSSGGASYFWNFSTSTSTAQNPPPMTYTVTGQHVITLTVTSNNGCIDSTTTTVDVYDTPLANFTAQNVCEDELASFVDASTVGYGGPVNSWSWSFGDPLNSTSSVQNPTFTYIDSGTYVITLVAATSYCSDSVTDTIVVEPRPMAMFSESDSNGCAPLPVTFTNQSIFGATYLWDFGDGNTSNQTNPTYTFQNNNLSDTFYLVTLYTYSAFGCVDSVTDTITVLGNPTALFTSDAVLDCAPLQVSFSDSSIGAISWTWDFDDGFGSNIANPTHIFDNQTLFITNYTVSLTVAAANGCTDIATQNITVYPEPLFSFSIVPTSGCSPLTVQFPVAVGAVVYNWSFGDGGTSTGPNPTHTYYNSTTNNQVFTTQLIATSPFGCVDTVTGDVTVFPKPTAILNPAISQGCQPLAVTFTNGSFGGTAYSWNFGDGATSTSSSATLSHTFTNLTNDTAFYNTTLIVSTNDGCSDTASAEVRAFRYVEADFDVPQVGCHPFNAQFSDSSSNPNSWAWNFGDGGSSTVQHPLHNYINNGVNPVTFTAQLTVQTVEGCQDAISKTITVNHKPTAAILPISQQGCQPLTVNFANNTTGANSFIWDFGDGSGSTTSGGQSHVFSNNTNNNVTYHTQLVALTNQGCSDTANADVLVYRRIHADFAATTPGCHPFTSTMNDASVNPVTWLWNFGDGSFSGQQSPVHQFLNAGIVPDTFDVTLTVNNVEGCPDDTTMQVVVFPKPTANFTIDDSPACAGESTTFHNSSTLNLVNTWRFGNTGFPFVNNQASFDTAFANLSSSQLNFPIALIAENQFACRDTINKQMTVYPYINASFITFDEGCAPFDVEFTNLSVGSNLFQWEMGDGDLSFLEEPNHTYENNVGHDTVYQVVLTATSPFGCEDKDTFDILIHPTPIPVFVVDPTVQRYPDTVFNFTNMTGGGPWNYEWNFGDGTTEMVQEVPTHSYSNWKQYRIVLKAFSDYCEDTTSRTVVLEPPFPIASTDVSAAGCAPVTVTFDHQSEYGVSYFWEFGDGATSSSEFPSYTYQAAGTYTVRLTVTGPGGDLDEIEIVEAVSVYEQPVANFVYTPTEVSIPAPVTFVNYSLFADEYLWDFGDSTTSTEANPQKIYTSGGQYFPYLVVSTEFGCRDTFYGELPINAVELGQLEIPNAFVPNPDGANGGLFDPFAYNNQIFFPVLTGVASEEYTLSIFNRWGELLFETTDVRQGWDGYYRDRICPQDVYVWKMKGKYVNGQKFSKVGDVTLIQ